MTLAILLVLASLFVFVLEVLFVSFGMLSLVAVALGVGGLLSAFAESTTLGWILTAVLVVGIPVVLRTTFAILPRLPFARGFYLRPPELSESERRAAAPDRADLVGATGIATSQLRPAGTVEIDGRPVSVVAAAGMIERGTKVRVVRVSGNRVLVEPVP
jgi:membrane-bound ClpP family serine protease